VGGQIVHDDDIALRERGNETFFHPFLEQGGVDRPVVDLRRDEATKAQASDERDRFIMAMRDANAQPPSSPAASAFAREIGGNVLTRVAEILERAVVRTEITIERLTEMYLQDRAEAYKLGQLAVAKGAIDSLAKLHGLWIERSERKNINASDDEQLDAELRRLRSEAAEIEASRNSRPN
jgi:hypothetical protein